jgi:HAD superfamily hydrolase (TIGR01484 family)
MEMGEINPRNITAVQEFISLGGTFCIATGRCTAAIEHIVSEFKNLNYAIVCNGSVIYDYTKNKTVMEKFLEQSDKFFFKRLIEKIPQLGVEVYCGKEVYLLNSSEPCRVHCEYEFIKPKCVDFEQIKDLAWNKAMCFYNADFPEEKIEEFIKEFDSENCEYTRAGFAINGIDFRGYEQLPGGANKGFALGELSKLLGVSKCKIFAVGDYYNDIPLLKAAGCAGAILGRAMYEGAFTLEEALQYNKEA